jgi:predicted RNA-binding protein YlxR (DUF448 family)
VTATPIRTCIGCGERAAQSELVRLRTEGERVIVDRARTGGRGAWLHADGACLDRAVRRRAFGRALRRPDVRADAAALRVELTGSPRKD